MSSSINARHFEDGAETPRKSFEFIASSVPQNNAKSCPDTVSTSECLTPPPQFKEPFTKAVKKLFCGRMSQLIMEADKSTWREPSKFNELNQRLNFFDRDKRVIKDVDITKHFQKVHTIIVSPTPKAPHSNSKYFKFYKPNPNPKGYYYALDIDLNLNEIELVIELKKIEKETSLKIYYCRSTGGKGWHLWGFSQKFLPFHLLKNAALNIKKLLPFEVDKVLPNGCQGITMPFAKHRPLKNTNGNEIKHPEQLKRIENFIFDSLEVIEQPPKPAKEIIQESNPDPNYSRSYGHVDFQEQIKQELKKTLVLSEYTNKLNTLYPIKGNRQGFWLRASADLFYFGISEAEAILVLTRIAKEHGDISELSNRETAVRNTYTKASSGQKILGFRTHGTLSKFKIIAYSALNKIAVSLRHSLALKRVLTAMYKNKLSTKNLGDFSERLLSELTGLHRTTIRECIRELMKDGILQRTKNTLNSYHYTLTVLGTDNVFDFLIEPETTPTLEDKARYEARKAFHTKERGVWAIFINNRYPIALSDILKPLQGNSGANVSPPPDEYSDTWETFEPEYYTQPKFASQVSPTNQTRLQKTLNNIAGIISRREVIA